MQMNREDLGERYREVLLPIPGDKRLREQWSRPIADYFTALAATRESYDRLAESLRPDLFADRP